MIARTRGPTPQSPPAAEPSQAVSPREGSRSLAWLDRIWAVFASVRLAFILIVLLALASLVGVLIVQASPSVREDPIAYSQWLVQIQPKYSFATPLFDWAGFFHIFSTPWFRGLIVLLAANILVCTMNRTGPLFRAAVTPPKVEMPPAFFDRAGVRLRLAVDGLTLDQGAAALRRGLRAKGYRVTVRETPGAVHVYGERNRWAPVGTLVHHMSMVILLLGFVINGVWGYDNSDFVVAEGTTRQVGDTGLLMRLDSFADEYYPEGPPKDYRSSVTLFDGTAQVREAVVRVNQPLVYDGVRIHQSFFGPAAMLEVRDAQGTVLSTQTVPLAWRAGERPAGSFLINDSGLEVYVIGPATTFIDPVISPGQVRLEIYQPGERKPLAMGNVTQGTPQALGGHSFTFVRERQFSGFSVVQAPGRPWMWAGAIGLVVGLMWTLYFPNRKLWARSGTDGNRVILQVGGAAGRGSGRLDEFKGLAARIGRATTHAGGTAGDQVVEGR